MGIGYQATDRKVIDYDLWFHGDSKLAFRGPRGNLRAKGAICCIGAAQTFGRFVKRPFAAQIADILDRQVLNLGFSGAGPEFYLRTPLLMRCLSQAEITIVQSMSARSVSAGFFEAQKNIGMLKFMDGKRKGQNHLAHMAYKLLREDEGEESYQAQIKTVQNKWVENHKELAAKLSGRKIFLWLSSRTPQGDLGIDKSPVGIFPHFVNREMVDEIAGFGFEILECVLVNMKGQILVNDTTGIVEDVFDAETFPNRPKHLRAINSYYATPELHNMAARILIQHLLSSQS